MWKRLALRIAVAIGVLGLGLTGTAQTPAPQPVSQDDLRTWLTYLSSDELQGRLAYSEGLGLAAVYIADHLKAWGVQPAGDNGTYFQSVRVQGIRTRSRSSVTVTVKGETRTFKDGEGVTFPRNQGAKQTVAAEATFAGYGVVFPKLNLNDYATRNVTDRIVVALGRRGPAGFTNAHNRILAARGRLAIDTNHALAFITESAPAPTTDAPVPAAPPVPEAQRVDFQTAQRLDSVIAPQITAGEEFFTFLFSASGVPYKTLKDAGDAQGTLPDATLSDVSISINVDADYDVVQTRLTRNVVGRITGTDAALRDTYLLLGAHYDHLGYEQFGINQRLNAIASCTGQTRPTPRPGDIILNGADDDGSGTVTLMALAQAFARGPQTRRSLLFVWHTAEEGGLSGSRYMADHPVVPLERVSAQLNIDMVGRNNCDDPTEANTVYVVGSDRISTELHNLNEDANARLAAPLTLNYSRNDPSDLESIYTRSDHFSYASRGVPIIFFTTGLHRDYHYVTDEIDKIEFPKMARIASLIYATATGVANLDHAPARDNLGPRVGEGRAGRIDTGTTGGR